MKKQVLKYFTQKVKERKQLTQNVEDKMQFDTEAAYSTISMVKLGSKDTPGVQNEIENVIPTFSTKRDE